MKTLSLTLLLLSFAMCVYCAYTNNMFAVVWALNVLINLRNYNKSKNK